jgi:DNA-binding NarL/FixJ family response regulator
MYLMNAILKNAASIPYSMPASANRQLRLNDESARVVVLSLDRDHNAALNILEAGHRLILSHSVEVHSLKATASGVRGSCRR